MLFILLALIPFISDVLVGLFTSGRGRGHYTRYIIAFSSGIVISAAFFELLPEANIEVNGVYVALGFFIFYLVEKVTMLHACGEEECDVHTLGPLSVLGMALDNVIDGVGIAVATLVDPIIGITLTIAVVSHEIPQALSSVYIMEGLMRPYRETMSMLVFAGAMYPAGALISLLIPEELHTVIIALVAGVFLYVGAGDLLMEAHRRFNIKVVVMVLLGASLGFFIHLLG
jgi:zinc and cadmium transporter